MPAPAHPYVLTVRARYRRNSAGKRSWRRRRLSDIVTRNTKDFPPERYDFVEVPYVVRPRG